MNSPYRLAMIDLLWAYADNLESELSADIDSFKGLVDYKKIILGAFQNGFNYLIDTVKTNPIHFPDDSIIHCKTVMDYMKSIATTFVFGSVHGLKKQFVEKMIEIFKFQSSGELIQEASMSCMVMVNFTKVELLIRNPNYDECDVDDIYHKSNITKGYVYSIRMKLNPTHPYRSKYKGQPDRNMIAA